MIQVHDRDNDYKILSLHIKRHIKCNTKLDVKVQYIITVNTYPGFTNQYINFILIYDKNKQTKLQCDHE